MKYYFVNDTENIRHILVAHNEGEVKRILKDAHLVSKCSYELKEDTFDKVGFLISDK